MIGLSTEVLLKMGGTSALLLAFWHFFHAGHRAAGLATTAKNESRHNDQAQTS